MNNETILASAEPHDATPIAMVYSTYDYGWFKFIDGNRKTDHVKALIESFQKRDVPNAILCNEYGEIIDGQNRFLARKELGLPILYYCVEGLNIYDVASLNSYGKNWGTKEFIQMWADLGNENYRKIFEFRKIYPDFTLMSSLSIITGSSGRRSHYTFSDKTIEKIKKYETGNSKIADGRFVFSDWVGATFRADCIMAYKPFSEGDYPIYRSENFCGALVRLLRLDSFKNAEMVSRVWQYRNLFYRCTNVLGYIEMFQKLHNHNRSKNKVDWVRDLER